ncbi:PEPxxWA-CTERM sorting domain-containing protein [Sphingomonas sp. BIUV-7]|uniref:PEPxxWA-CTERM sorting domain-containing protein n=1 Tax=Sphingomonas natans TaxID=3063330 RepID=A0ABT8YCC8_9SPHN|nr:PEPxxWA-CTERM sorting domain-containing protein [Sphingomonas sp. BIUV-7]MDO6415483.1 PEPxxWA-CTERM sorting domain-containing protein [Sphingomonas sp. BIUV-7]
MRRNRIVSVCLLAGATLVPAFAAAQAAPVIVTLNSSFAAAPATIDFSGSSFTFSSTGDIFAPVALQTSGGGAVSAFGGFLGIPVSPTTDFPGRGSGILTYGPGMQFAAFPTTTTIPYSNGDNYLGLRATLNGLDYYGYAFTTDTKLNSFGFETTANTAFTINTNAPAAVPEAATWAMMLVGFGAIGGALRRQRAPKVNFA